MKQLIFGIALVISIHSFAQTNTDKPIPLEDPGMDAYLRNRKPATLHIKVINSKKNLSTVMVRYSIVHPGSETQQTENTGLDINGVVSIELKENLPYQQVWLSVDGFFYSGLVVNSDLNVLIDASKVKDEVFLMGEGVSLTGADAALNTQLMKNVLYKRDEKSPLNSLLPDVSIKAANKMIGVPEFLKTADSIYTALKKYDEDFLKENPGFEWAIRNERESSFFEWLIVGFSNKDMPGEWMAKVQTHKPYFMSNEGIGFYRSLSGFFANKNYEKSKALKLNVYKNRKDLTTEQKLVLDSIALLEATEDQQKSELLKALYTKRYKLFKAELDKIDLEQSILSIKQYAKGGRADILQMQLMERWKDQFAFAYPVLLDQIEARWARRFVQNKLEIAITSQKQIDELFKTASVIQPADNYYIGKPVADLPFDARLYKLDSIAKIEDFLANLRAKFSNKVLVFDIWATWCAPCIGDIPNGIRLHKDNSDLPIEYIYLCTTSGSDEETWKRRIATLKPPGHHIFIDDVLLTSLRKLLRAEGGYPTYVVIDREGKVNAKAISFMSGMDRAKLKEATGIQ